MTARTKLGPGGYPVGLGLAPVSATVASTWHPSDAVSATQTIGTVVASAWQPSDAIAAALSQSAAVASTWLPSDHIAAALTLPAATVALTWLPSDAVLASQVLLATVASTWQPSDSITAVYAPPPPQPGPQLGTIRERTYRRRFLGVGYDPICVITKDRPGPLRIIEFVGEMKDE